METFKSACYLGQIPVCVIGDSLAFASEPVFASLSNVLGIHERLPSPLPPDIRDHDFIELEIKHGIVQITDALAYVHNKERLIHCNIGPHSILLNKKGGWKLFGFGFAEKIKDGKMHDAFGDVAHKMPLQLVEPVEKMINKDVRYRPTAQLFSLLKYFNDPVVISLHGMDMCDRREPAQRVEAYASLSQVVPNIPRKILYSYVLPDILNECRCPDSIIFALPTLITIIDYATRTDYVEIIMPEFRAILANNKPVQATVYILSKLDIILSKSPQDEIKVEVLPFVFNTLDSSSLQAQEAALNAVADIRDFLDDSILRKVVLPKAKSLFFRSNNVRIRINALTCIDHLLDSLDKMLILDNILPFLANISGQDPDVIMCVVGIYKHMLSDKKFGLTHNLIATKVMPTLIPHTVNPGLNMEQFGGLMEVLRDMLDQVDTQRRDKMKQETVTLPVPPRGSLKMMSGENGSDDNLSTSHQAILLENARTQQLQKSKTTPGTPESVRINKMSNSPKNSRKNQSLQSLGMSLDEKSTLDKPIETIRRHSLIPPASSSSTSNTSVGLSNGTHLLGLGTGVSATANTTGSNNNTPTISITADDMSPDRPRRPSTHSLGPFSVSGLTDFLTRAGGTSTSSSTSGAGGGGGGGGVGGRDSGSDRLRSSPHHRRPSMAGILPLSPAESRRPSTHSVGILPISMFGEGGEKPRRPSTHSLGVFSFGCLGDDKPERPRRCSAHSLGPLVVP
ncbi:scy1-like protein 2 isoform x5, partial [Plakobranchus ocellatus]